MKVKGNWTSNQGEMKGDNAEIPGIFLPTLRCPLKETCWTCEKKQEEGQHNTAQQCRTGGMVCFLAWCVKKKCAKSESYERPVAGVLLEPLLCNHSMVDFW